MGTGPDDPAPDETRPIDAADRTQILRFQSLARGATFAGRFEIRGVLGAGGAGEVFAAHDRLAGEAVAVKVLFPGGGERDLERLGREVRAVRGLRHPGILRVHDVGEVDGLFYVVSELLEGETLASRLKRERRLPVGEAERVLRGMLEALGAAHRAGVVHRDVKRFTASSPNGGSRCRRKMVEELDRLIDYVPPVEFEEGFDRSPARSRGPTRISPLQGATPEQHSRERNNRWPPRADTAYPRRNLAAAGSAGGAGIEVDT